MENWHQCIFLGAAIACATIAQADTDSGEVAAKTGQQQVIQPEIERRSINRPNIDTEDFEVGPFVGVLSIQDFDSDIVYGLRAAWHVSEDFFFEANYGVSQGDTTSYEDLSGGAPLFDDADRDYSYYSLNLGWNIFPGESFFYGGRAFQSDLYLIGGAGNTDFLGDTWFTATIGVGYRLLLNDSFALRLDVRDHIFDRDALGQDETTNNIEWSSGVTWFF
jgi:outer membrane beta-barrel protein